MNYVREIAVPPGDVLVASPSPAAWQFFADSRVPVSMAQAAGGADALAKLATGAWRWLVLDRHLPDLNSEEVARIVRTKFPRVSVLMLHSSLQSRSQPLATCTRVRGQAPDPDINVRRRPASASSAPKPLPGMIGQSESMLHVYRMARLVAGRNTTVLITGETGTGKELVAQGIHQLSPRSHRPLVVVNCAAIPESLLESELFGHTRGAFTGAVQSQTGRFQAAHGGTLFLDEIGELPLALQPKLLRFLETKEVQRLGSAEPVKLDVRVIAATNVDLERQVEERAFREDLFYRLSAFCIELPALRHRREDIVSLARTFVAHVSSETHGLPPQINAEVVRLLEEHSWKGNVRELQLVLEQACILADGAAQIEPEHLRFSGRRSSHRLPRLGSPD